MTEEEILESIWLGKLYKIQQDFLYHFIFSRTK